MPNIRITKSQEQGYDGYAVIKYFISSEFAQGTACMRMKPIKNCTVGITERVLAENSLSPNDFVAYVDRFQPLGRVNNSNPDHIALMRHGVGSAVLEEIIADANNQGAKMIFTTTVSPSMRSFLNKHGFSYSDVSASEKDARFWYKVL